MKKMSMDYWLKTDQERAIGKLAKVSVQKISGFCILRLFNISLKISAETKQHSDIKRACHNGNFKIKTLEFDS